ncbi:hypothetical protein [Bdellovibrio svalbardensis]|uniref:DNA-binding domain-containing protein n=1 Tax=Bdellovibrio svalbardensis TaxID=2972972 RepID=A0ABT6DMY1_9BACT|nr:hypothetical protein [Bdellovibrio svalbardensis]MDG0818235.1 hypothetical protein [Bdellovibrio svalbardensis]
MSTNNETCQIAFPWNGVLPPLAETVILRDIEVVGVGAKRRQQIESLQKSKHVILQTHESQIPDAVRPIYDEEMLRTLQWLRPVKIQASEKIDLHSEQQKIFSKIFPLTEKAFGFSAAKVRDTYLQEMEWSSWLLQDHWRYFVGFLRQRFPQQKQIVDLAFWEWVHAWLEMQPFDLNVKSEPGILTVNPTLQIVPLLEPNRVLDKEQGMYSFIFSAKENRVVERPLQAAEAFILDLLQEDRKYSETQIIDMALLSEDANAQLSKDEWQKTLQSMLAAEILILGS